MTWIGSNLIGALIACYCSLRPIGGGLRVVNASQKIVDAIAFNQLSEVILVESSPERATQSLMDSSAREDP
jgi:hypothetical protein